MPSAVPRWAAYLLAGVVPALASAPAAEGDIHQTDVQQVINSPGTPGAAVLDRFYRQPEANLTLLHATGPMAPSCQQASMAGGYVAFNLNFGRQYGRAQRVMDGPSLNSFRIGDYAFADMGDAFLTGQVPEPGSLALLAVSAAGLLAWRQKRLHRTD